MEFTAGGIQFQLYPLPRKRRPAVLIAYHVGSRRARDTFRGTVAQAKGHCKTLARKVSSGDAALHLSPLDARIYLTAKEQAARLGRPVDAIVREYAEARRILGSATLLEAARAWKTAHPDLASDALLADVVAEFLAAIKSRAAPDRLRYHEDMDQRLGALVRHLPGARMGDLAGPLLEQWLAQFNGLSPRSWNKYRAAVLTFCNFCAGLSLRHRPARRYLPADHPARDLPMLEDHGGRREFFTSREVAALLDSAPPHLIPALALGAFAGLRQSEIWRLEWIDLDFEGHVVSLDRFQAKTYGERHIEMSEPLRRWLAPFSARREGRVALHARGKPFAHPNGLTRAMSSVADGRLMLIDGEQRELRWKDNGLRHAYATHRIPVAGYAAAAAEMGTSERKLLHHYRKPMTVAKAVPYWANFPRDRAVIEFDFARGAKA